MPKVIGALAGLPGIIEVEAFYPEKEARLVYDPASIEIDRILQTLSLAGYVASLKEPGDLPPPVPPPPTQSLKGFGPDALVCYCFGYTREDIEKDFLQHRRSLILEKIAAEKKAGGCDCANKHPKRR